MDKQKNRQKTMVKSSWRFLLGVMALCAAFSLLGDIAAMAVHWMEGFSFAVRDAATIGVIGGADGPTAIFVTASISPVWHSVLKLLILSASLLGLRCLKKGR